MLILRAGYLLYRVKLDFLIFCFRNGKSLKIKANNAVDFYSDRREL